MFLQRTRIDSKQNVQIKNIDGATRVRRTNHAAPKWEIKTRDGMIEMGMPGFNTVYWVLSDYKTDVYTTFQINQIVPEYKALQEKSMTHQFENISMIMEHYKGNFPNKFSNCIVDRKVFGKAFWRVAQLVFGIDFQPKLKETIDGIKVFTRAYWTPTVNLVARSFYMTSFQVGS